MASKEMVMLKRAIFYFCAILIFLPAIAHASDSRCSNIQLSYYYQDINEELISINLERPSGVGDGLRSAHVIQSGGASTLMTCPASSRPVVCPADDYDNCHASNTAPSNFWCFANINVSSLSDIQRVEIVFFDPDDDSEYTCKIQHEMLVAPEMEGSVVRTLSGIEAELVVDDQDWINMAEVKEGSYCLSIEQSDGTEVYRCDVDMSLYESTFKSVGGSIVMKSNPIEDANPSNPSDIKNIVRVSYFLDDFKYDNNPTLADCPEHSVASQDGTSCECAAGYTSSDGRLCNSGPFMLHFVPLVFFQVQPSDTEEEEEEPVVTPEEEGDEDDGFLSIVPDGEHAMPQDEGEEAADDSVNGGTTTITGVDRTASAYGGGACNLVGASSANPLGLILFALSFIPIVVRRRGC